jgi:hypothetical protein
MNYFFRLLALVLTLASVCASAHPPEVPPPGTDEDRLPKQELTGQILYQFLLAEIAAQRGQFGLFRPGNRLEQEGDICADGPSVHLGYHDNPAANAEAFLQFSANTVAAVARNYPAPPACVPAIFFDLPNDLE